MPIWLGILIGLIMAGTTFIGAVLILWCPTDRYLEQPYELKYEKWMQQIEAKQIKQAKKEAKRNARQLRKDKRSNR